MTVKKFIGPPSLWTETFPELVIRWHRTHPEAERDRIGSASIVARKANERGLRVLAYTNLAPGREILSAREWQTRWDAPALWSRLAQHAERIGWKPIRDRQSTRSQADVQSAALAASGEGQAILILERVLQEQLATIQANQCPLDLNLEDLAVITLARELFAIEAERIGRPPRDPWIDELARHEFTQALLGLPFSPLVFQLLS